MPGELLVLAVVEVVGGLIAQVGGQAAHAKGRSWLDRRELDNLSDDAKQAFIAGLVFVASYDGALSELELEEMGAQLHRLEIDEKHREVALALAAREEVAAAVANGDAGYAQKLVDRIPEGRAREALLRVAIAVAMRGDLERQLAAVRLLGKAMGLDSKKIDTTITDERQRLVR